MIRKKIKKRIKAVSARLAENQAVKRLGEKFDLLGSSKKSIIIKIVSGITVLALIWYLAVTWNKTEEAKRKPELKEEEVAVQLDETLLQETWIEKASEMVTRHERQITDIQTEVENIQKNIKNIEEMFSEISETLKEIKEKGIQVASGEEAKKTEEEKETGPSPEAEKEAPEKVEKLYQKGASTLARYPQPKPAPAGQPQQKPPTGPSQKMLPPGAGLIYADYTPPEPVAKKEDELKKLFMFPPGSFAKAVILTGVNAPTGLKAKTQPQPVVFLARDLSFLPNDFRADIDRCLMVGEAYGELASERVYVRVNRISCISKDRKILIAEAGGPIGYAVDSDGRIGLSGKVYSRRGLLLARSLVANFIEGVARAFRTSLTAVSVTPLGGTITAEQSTSDAIKIALGEGVGKSLEELAKTYQELASQTFPVIVVPAGREIHVVMLAPVEFKPVGILSEKI